MHSPGLVQRPADHMRPFFLLPGSGKTSSVPECAYPASGETYFRTSPPPQHPGRASFFLLCNDAVLHCRRGFRYQTGRAFSSAGQYITTLHLFFPLPPAANCPFITTTAYTDSCFFPFTSRFPVSETAHHRRHTQTTSPVRTCSSPCKKRLFSVGYLLLQVLYNIFTLWCCIFGKKSTQSSPPVKLPFSHAPFRTAKTACLPPKT